MALRVAVIGAGRRGRAHAEAIADLKGVARVVGIADIDEVRAHALASASAPRGAAYRDPLVLLRETEPDVVYITTPPSVHREQAIAALEYGAHLVLEKPIALTVDDAEAIGDAAEKSGRLVHVCHQLRYSPGVLELRNLLSRQRVALTHIWNYRKGPDIPGNWSREWGGGHVVEWGIHYLDLCRYLMGTEATEVYARYTDQVLHGQEGWDNWDGYSLAVQWANGAVCSYASSYALKPGIPFDSGLVLVAEEGQATVHGLDCAWTTPEDRLAWPATPGHGERELAQTFFYAVTSGDAKGLRQSFDDALRTHRLVMAANESAMAGRPVRL